jgi:hypothetical protein
LFISIINFLDQCIGSKVFYHNKSFNKTLFEAIMYLTAQELKRGLECEKFKKFYESLISDQDFWGLSKHFPTSRKNIIARLNYVQQLYNNT